MSDVIGDGKVRVVWATSIANINAPTVAELTAGTDATLRVTPDGLKTDPTTAAVDTGSLASTYDTEEVGRTKFANELTLKRGDTVPEDLLYGTLVKGVRGFMIVRRGIPYATAWAAGQQVEVYPTVCGERQNKATAPNEVMKYVVPMFVTTEPATNALVA
ncbi:phage tail tube protein [Kitasatospora sp. NPDC054939]